MFFNRYKDEGNDYNECVSRGNCSISPELRAFQEVMIIFLRQLAYFELKQCELNISYYENKETILDGILSLVATNKYTNEQLLEIISKIYSKLLYAKKEYANFCEEKKIKTDEFKLTFKLTPQMTINEIIKTGEKILLAKYKKISQQHKNLYEILLLTIKSVALNLEKLNIYNKFDDKAYKEILVGLNLLNYTRTSAEKIKENIDILAKTDLGLINQLALSQEERFGEIQKKEVSKSTIPGKALLVSGENLQILYEVLVQSDDLDFSVYTHSDLLIAHAYEKFAQFKHLKGHYGSCSNNCVLDFATFPGPILLTKSDYPNIDYLYRGKLYSSEKITPQGILQIKNNDYNEIFKSALDSKGFSKGRQVESIDVGYNYNDLIDRIKSINDKINSGKIKHLFIIGMSDYSYSNDEYYKKMYDLIDDNSFIITFSYHYNVSNELYINLSNNLPAIYKVLLVIFNQIPIDSEYIAFFFSKCDANSISNIINLSNLGAKKIFLSQCPPNTLNPNLLSTLKNIYNVNTISTPKDDLKLIYWYNK